MQAETPHTPTLTESDSDFTPAPFASSSSPSSSLSSATFRKSGLSFFNSSRGMGQRVKAPAALHFQQPTPPLSIERKRHATRYQIHPLGGSLFPDLAEQPEFGDASDSHSRLARVVGTHSIPRAHRLLESSLCCICLELVLCNLPGEIPFPLFCEHKVHFECYKLVMNAGRYEENLVCPVCRAPALCEAEVAKQLRRRVSLEVPYVVPPASFTTDCITPLTNGTCLASPPLLVSAEIMDSPRDSSGCSFLLTNSNPPPTSSFSTPLLAPLPIPSPLAVPSLSAHSCLVRHPYSLLDLYNPQVSAHFGSSELVLSPSTSRTVLVLLEVSAPLLGAAQSLKESEPPCIAIGAAVERYLSLRLSVSPTLEHSWGRLLLFDSFSLSVNGEAAPKTVQLFLFTTTLLIVNEAVTTILGQVDVAESVVSLNKLDEHTLTVDLNISSLLELRLQTSDSLLLLKWETYLTRIVNHVEVRPCVMHHTVTRWNWVELEIGCPIPSLARWLTRPLDVAKKESVAAWSAAIPTPSAPCVVVIAVLSLVNATGLEAYTHTLKTLLTQFRTELGASDLLGVVFVGRNGLGVRGLVTTFVGCVSPTWSGWDEIINNIRTHSAIDADVPDTFEELVLGLENAKKLLAMLPALVARDSRVAKHLVFVAKERIETTSERPLWLGLTPSAQTLRTWPITVLLWGGYTTGQRNFLNMLSKASVHGPTGVVLTLLVSRCALAKALHTALALRLQEIHKQIPAVLISVRSVYPSLLQFTRLECHGEMQLMSHSGRVEARFGPATGSRVMQLEMEVSGAAGALNHSPNRLKMLELEVDSWMGVSLPHSVCVGVRVNSAPEAEEEFHVESERVICQTAESTHSFSEFPVLLTPVVGPRDCALWKRKSELLLCQTMLRVVALRDLSGARRSLQETISVIHGIILNCKNSPDRSVETTLSDRNPKERYTEYMFGLLEVMTSLNNLFASRCSLVEAKPEWDECWDLFYRCLLQGE